MTNININIARICYEKFKSPRLLYGKLGNDYVLFCINKFDVWKRNYKQWDYEEYR